MDYQLYQLLLFFATYAILGWIINLLYRAIVGETVTNTKVCKGPYCPTYGFGAVALLCIMTFLENTPPVAFVTGAIVGSIVEIVTIILTGLCSGAPSGKFKWYHPLLWGSGGTILMTHVHPLMEVGTNRVSPWIHFGFLVVFLIVFISDYVDGIWTLLEQRKNRSGKCESADK